MTWTVYILLCSDNTLYTGITTDIDNRLTAHTMGKGAKYTRGRAPFKLVYTESHTTKGSALTREVAIKSLPRKQKLELVGYNIN